MQRMKKIGVVTNSFPLLTLNAEGGGGLLVSIEKRRIVVGILLVFTLQIL